MSGIQKFQSEDGADKADKTSLIGLSVPLRVIRKSASGNQNILLKVPKVFQTKLKNIETNKTEDSHDLATEYFRSKNISKMHQPRNAICNNKILFLKFFRIIGITTGFN